MRLTAVRGQECPWQALAESVAGLEGDLDRADGFEQAAAQLRAHASDLVLVGPGADAVAGRAFVAELRKARATRYLPILVVARSLGDFAIADDESAVPIDLVVLPVTADELRLRVRQLQRSARLLSAPDISPGEQHDYRRMLDEVERLTGLVTWEWDIRNNQVSWSRAAFARIGLKPEDFGASYEGFLQLVHPDDREHARAQVEAALYSGEAFDYEFRLTGPDGVLRSLRARGQVERDATGTPVRMFGTDQDITERKRAAELQQKLQTELLHSQKQEALGRLAAGVAHDFNNLLTAILASADLMLAHWRPPDRARDLLAGVVQAARQASALTRQLLAFARKQVISPAVVELNDHVSEAGKLIQRVLGEDVVLRLELGADAGRILIDPTQLDQVLLNLAANARDAMPRGGALTIRTEAVELAQALGEASPGPFALLSVSDTGVGMDSETLQNAFEPFFTTKDRAQGTGLGLATALGIAQQNGGHIAVESKLGSGTRFLVYLPRVDRPSVRPPAPGPVEGSRTLHTVLVVEDDALVRQVAQDVLVALGFEVFVAQDAGAALAILGRPEGERIDLLFTDVVLPGLNGRDLADLVRRQKPHVRVLFTSGYSGDALSNRGVLDPGVTLLEKPYSLTTLEGAIQKLFA